MCIRDRVDERDELARHIDDADAVAATLRRQVADLGTERDAHELDAKKLGRRVRELEREAETAVDLKRQLVSLKTDRDDLQTMSDARSAALHRRVSTLEAELAEAAQRLPPLRAEAAAAEDAAREARRARDDDASAFRRRVAALEARLTEAERPAVATPQRPDRDQLLEDAEGRVQTQRRALLSATHERDEAMAQHLSLIHI